MRTEADRYPKVVEWTDADQCFVGSAPGLLYGGCHGDDELAVFTVLQQIVTEVIELYREDGRPLPEPVSVLAAT